MNNQQGISLYSIGLTSKNAMDKIPSIPLVSMKLNDATDFPWRLCYAECMNEHEEWFKEAGSVAQNALCLRAKCGAVIVVDGLVIGSGHNAPPGDDISSRKCRDENYDRTKKPKYDLTCCMHAEWRAIIDALKKNKEKLRGATLYYVRLDDKGHLRRSGTPFCTVCSRIALDVGIAKFGLWHESGITLYDTHDYNERSYAYHEKATSAD